jgi:hypothetical protein
MCWLLQTSRFFHAVSGGGFVTALASGFLHPIGKFDEKRSPADLL